MGDRVAGLPEGTFSGSIDFQNALALCHSPCFYVELAFFALAGSISGVREECWQCCDFIDLGRIQWDGSAIGTCIPAHEAGRV